MASAKLEPVAFETTILAAEPVLASLISQYDIVLYEFPAVYAGNDDGGVTNVVVEKVTVPKVDVDALALFNLQYFIYSPALSIKKDLISPSQLFVLLYATD